MIAQARVQSAYRRYSAERSSSGYTGVQVARTLLQENGVFDVDVVQGNGQLSDHYDPRKRSIILSPGVYQDTSIAALAIAAHETGHALQHSESYLPLALRNSIAPGIQISSSVAIPLFFAGLLLGLPFLIQIGIYLFSAVVLFQLVTMPVEFDASRRALIALDGFGFVTPEEYPKARKMLSAAALTYVASLMVSFLQLIRLLSLAGGNRRRR